MSDDLMRFRPMLIAEVAQVAGDPRETIRTRYKKGTYQFEKAKGWRRFSDFETIAISLHSRLKRLTNDDELAEVGFILASNLIIDEWIEDEGGAPYFRKETFTKERLMFFWRNLDGRWEAEIRDMGQPADEALRARFEESSGAAPAFTVVNLRTLLLETLLAIMKVQIESGVTSFEGKE